jgi:hypothetical protein
LLYFTVTTLEMPYWSDFKYSDNLVEDSRGLLPVGTAQRSQTNPPPSRHGHAPRERQYEYEDDWQVVYTTGHDDDYYYPDQGDTQESAWHLPGEQPEPYEGRTSASRSDTAGHRQPYPQSQSYSGTVEQFQPRETAFDRQAESDRQNQQQANTDLNKLYQHMTSMRDKNSRLYTESYATYGRLYATYNNELRSPSQPWALTAYSIKNEVDCTMRPQRRR